MHGLNMVSTPPKNTINTRSMRLRSLTEIHLRPVFSCLILPGGPRAVRNRDSAEGRRASRAVHQGRIGRRRAVSRVPAEYRRRAQQLNHGLRRKIAPFDPHTVPMPARHVRADDRRGLGEPSRQNDGDLDPGKHPKIHAGRDVASAHAQIRQPAGAHGIGPRPQPHQEIHPNRSPHRCSMSGTMS